jgi:hypothetical protein
VELVQSTYFISLVLEDLDQFKCSTATIWLWGAAALVLRGTCIKTS